MRKALLCLFLLLGSGAYAQVGQVPAAVQPGSSYLGYGDAVSTGATLAGWYSCSQAYTAAQAAATAAACTLRRAQDNTTQVIDFQTNGLINSTAALSFGGQDATGCPVTLSGTTLTITGACSTNAHSIAAWSTFTASGIVGPAYVVSLGTCTATVTSTPCTININTLASGSSFTGGTIAINDPLFVVTANDLTGLSFAATEATAVNQPPWIANCGGASNAYACIVSIGTSSGQQQLIGTTNITPATGTASLVSVVQKVTGANTSYWASETTQQGISGTGSANQWRLNGTSGSVTVTANDAVWHVGTGVIDTTVSSGSFLTVDGAAVTTGTITGGTTAQKTNILASTVVTART